jgi:PAS domain S-box-containing protein
MTSEQHDDGLLGLAERIAGVGHWRFDIATRKIKWSDEVFRIHGLSRTGIEPEYADLLELYHPDDRNVLSALVDRAMTFGEGYDLEARIFRPDGAMRHVVAKADCIRDENGRVVSLYGVFQDVTERNQADRFVRTLTAHIPAMVGYWDTALRCRYANAQYREWFGRMPHEMIGISMPELMGDELFRRNEPFIRAAMSGAPQEFERMLTKPSGEVGHTLARYIPDVDHHGQVVGMFVLVTDVTALKESQLRLQETCDALRDALKRAHARLGA